MMTFTRLFLLTMIICLPMEVGATSWEAAAPDRMTDSEIGDPFAAPIVTSQNSKVLFIYVVFPGEEPSSGFPEPAYVDSVGIGLANHLFNQSGGVVDVSPAIVTNPGHVNGWWVADHPAATYNNADSVNGIEQYRVHWAGNYTWLGELQAEILHKVDSEYSGNGLGNPFTDVSLVQFIYYGDAIETDGRWVQGYGRNSVNPSTFGFLDVMSDDFSNIYPDLLPGVQQEAHEVSLWDLRWIVSHETGHYFRLKHSPSSSCDGGYRPALTAHYYGPYSNMSLVRISGKGPIPYHPVDLVQLKWAQQKDIGASVRSYELGDIRLTKEVLKVPLSSSQYFLLSYHGGNGMDANLGEDGTPIYPSQGLAVWHVVDGATDTDRMWDLESTSGRYDDPGLPSDGPGFWSVPDATNGYDNLDVFVDVCADPEGPRAAEYYDYFYNYPGSSEDFFGEMSGRSEFSFRTNPNTYGQTGTQRRAPQDIANSMIFRVLQESGTSVTLDIILEAKNSMLSPSDGDVLQVGQQSRISWDDDLSDYLGPTCTIEFCPDGESVSPTWGFLGKNIPVANGEFFWTPTRAHITTTGRFRIRFTSTNGIFAYSEMDDSSESFVTVVDVPQAVFTDVSGPDMGLNYSGVPYTGISMDTTHDGMKDLFVSVTGAGSKVFGETSVPSSGIPEFNSTVQFAIDDMRGAIGADFDNDGDEDLFVAHATTPKLYRNDGNNSFADTTVDMGLDNLAANSTAACWGDYDGDGWLDLFVVRSSRVSSEPPDLSNIYGDAHHLFHNEVRDGGGFVDVSVAAGLYPAAVNGSVSASWGDIDSDGDLDLVVINLEEPPVGPSIGSRLFVNRGDGTFDEEYDERFVGEIDFGTAARWADMDNDGDFDLVVSRATPGSAVYFNDGTGYFPIEQVVRFPLLPLAPGEGYSSVEVFDHDLDGWQDLLWVSRDAGKPSRFYSGVPTSSGVAFLDNTTNVNLDGSSSAMGVIAADFTNDGDSDLFVGRAIADGQYFYKTDSKSGSNSLGRNYVKLRLTSPFNANNRQGIGAQVTVTAGDLAQLQAVDGGSGRGSQKDRDLVFGLGSYSGPVTATVRWPGGYVQSGVPVVVSGGAGGETINTLSDETPPVIRNVTVTTYIVPGTNDFDWVFSWETSVGCDPGLDALTIDASGASNPCWSSGIVTPSSPWATHSYAAKVGGGYTHSFTMFGQECNANCSFQYTVSSGTGPNQVTSATKTKKVKFCPSQF